MNYDFLGQLWEIQVALASGYAAYAIAYTGLRGRQKTIDIVSISFVFSLIPTFVLWWLVSEGPVISSAAAFFISIVAGIIWRKLIRPFVFPILKQLNVTWSNDDPSALVTLSDNAKFRTSAIAVLLDDGTWLRCDDVNKFENAPFWPYILGENGDVALYLTHEESADENVKDLTTVRDSYYGDRITYVPASHIKQITIRHTSKANHSSKAAASVVEQAEPSA
jgi:hypothetical protein